MLILGYYGGTGSVYDQEPPTLNTHDGAAVLLFDGDVIAAVEEERINRIKHSNKAPIGATRCVLGQAGASLDDVDYIAFPLTLQFVEKCLRHQHRMEPSRYGSISPITNLRDILKREFGADVPASKFRFVRHHIAHATTSFDMSGFERALIVTLDDRGENESGLVLSGQGNQLQPLHTYPVSASLGHFYVETIRYIGYRPFDEYKAMGLAPYGDPERFRRNFAQFYRLLPGGGWELNFERLATLYELLTPRRQDEPIEQIHKDIAASLQDLLESVVLHALRHHRDATGHRNLCLGGGVALNCTMNGKILRSGLFDDVFVPPAAHDGGNALGAALHVYSNLVGRRHHRRTRNVYWGNDIGGRRQVERELRLWSPLIEIHESADIEGDTAQRLMEGHVVGWVQGRSEFGPRALGNRSILADPRWPHNKETINRMVKKRESFQPFAPSVLKEYAADYFEMPSSDHEFPFMVFVLVVRPEQRELLGAVTHVDGTARVQTVSRENNPRYWMLLEAFRQRSGIPVLLNTSFNNNVEPIVDSAKDAIVCFLTTDIHTLVIGDFIVYRRHVGIDDYLRLVPLLPSHARLVEIFQRHPDGAGLCKVHQLSRGKTPGMTISLDLYAILQNSNGQKDIRSLAEEAGINSIERLQTVVECMLSLWAQRVVQLYPNSDAAV